MQQLTIKILEDRIKELENALTSTRNIVCDGTKEGFNPLTGDWAERLFMNNRTIHNVLDTKAKE